AAEAVEGELGGRRLAGLGGLGPVAVDDAGAGVVLEEDEDAPGAAAEDLDDAVTDGALAEAAGPAGLGGPGDGPGPVAGGEAVAEQAARPLPGAAGTEEEAFVYGDDDDD